PVGRDAIISATFFGTAGAVALANVDGSFYHFRAERYDGTTRRVLSKGPDEWGGRAAVAWVSKLAASTALDPQAVEAIDVAAVIDGMYGR
ncbi:MAG TPA: hypothetical protein VHT30_11195, partial [Acidimicrobiales bacterium]|nr:hypothetical protein [Acidimicrobiales bacterium]